MENKKLEQTIIPGCDCCDCNHTAEQMCSSFTADFESFIEFLEGLSDQQLSRLNREVIKIQLNREDDMIEAWGSR